MIAELSEITKSMSTKTIYMWKYDTKIIKQLTCSYLYKVELNIMLRLEHEMKVNNVLFYYQNEVENNRVIDLKCNSHHPENQEQITKYISKKHTLKYILLGTSMIVDSSIALFCEF